MLAFDNYSIDFDTFDIYIQQASIDDGCSYKRLEDYILRQSPLGKQRTLFFFRGIFTWLLENYFCDVVNLPEKDCPLYLIKEYRCGNMTIHEVINSICRKFNIPSKTFHGISKPMDDEHMIGIYANIKERTEANWNAVKIEEKWYFIHTDILFPPRNDYDECYPIKASNNKTTQIRPNVESSAYRAATSYEQFWFLTDPRDFIYFCIPDEPSHQFLPSTDQVGNSEFLNSPLLYPAYFRYNLEIISDKRCELTATEGICLISIYTDKALAESVHLTCDLWLVNYHDCDPLPKEQTSKIVSLFRTADTFTFQLRFNHKGRYRAMITNSEDWERCCVFDILCDEAYTGIRTYLPEYLMEYGIGQEAIRAGIISSCYSYPKIFVHSLAGQGGRKSNDTTAQCSIRFKLSEDAIDTYKYTAELGSNDIQDYVPCKVDETKNELEVALTIPTDEEEYVLSLLAKANIGEAAQQFSPVCCYVISGNYDDREEIEIRNIQKQREQVKRQKFAQQLREEILRLEYDVAMLKVDITRLQKKHPNAAKGISLGNPERDNVADGSKKATKEISLGNPERDNVADGNTKATKEISLGNPERDNVADGNTNATKGISLENPERDNVADGNTNATKGISLENPERGNVADGNTKATKGISLGNPERDQVIDGNTNTNTRLSQDEPETSTFSKACCVM